MLSEFFGLVMDPFESGPDSRFLYMDGARRNAFAQLLSSVYECKGTVVLASERGLGKSTLIRHLADQLAALDSVLVLYPGGVLNCRPKMSFPAILAACRGRLDRRDKTAGDEDRLAATLERTVAQGQVAVLLLDDADTLDDVTLARLGQLSEPDGEDRRLISVILAGSPALAERLEGHAGRGRKAAAVDLLVELSPLRDRDVDRLIRHRLAVAGHDGGELFSPVAMAEITRRSRGNPARINALCAAALTLAGKEGKSTVSRDLVDRADERMADADDEGPASEVKWSEQRAADQWQGGEDESVPDPASGDAPGEEKAVEAKFSGPGKRLDDVAEAIRAADLRSTGGADPHIKYGPYAPGGAGTGEIGGRPPYAAADGEPRRDSRAVPAEAAYRVYPGVRPTGTQPRKRRRGFAKAALIGVVLAALAGGGAYIVRTQALSVDSLADQVRSLAARAIRSIEGIMEPDTALDDGTSLDEPAVDDRAGNGATADLGFERFGPVPQDNRQDRSSPYAYAPPPPHGGIEPPAEAPAPPAAAKPDVVAQPPATAKPDSMAEGAAKQPEQTGNAAGNAAPPAPETARAEPGNFDLLDPATAVILSRRGPPPAAKPAPPAPAASANAAAQPAPSAPPAAAKPAEPAPRTGKPEPDKAQVQPLLSRGDEYLGTGDLDMARTFYQMAYDRGSAEAAIRMGWTFDPQYFQRIGLRGEASPREAILWYQEALRRGSRQASERLSDLATWLQNAASAGDVEAQRILRMWQG